MEMLGTVSSVVVAFLVAIPWIMIVALPVAMVVAIVGAPMMIWASKSGSKISILIADDDEMSVMPLLTVLKRKKIPLEISYAVDGREALQFLKKKTYDLLILDYLMPKLCGDEVLSAADDLNEIKNVTHVMFYTSNKGEVESHLKKQYDKFVVDGVLEKTISLNKLDSKLNAVLHYTAS